jgi:hypothetical protein
MKVTACLLLLASTAMAAPKDAKAFSLFSVVTFPNNECTTVMDPTMRGLCITAEECTDQGGTASGNCASGFGVCCFTTITEQGTITNNVTYIQSEGFPTAILGTGTVAAATRAFAVQGGESICQVRFDFDTTVLTQPNGGVCANDQITVTQTTTSIGNGFTNLCGTISGQHIYVENDGANPAVTLNIITDNMAFARSWKILVRTIECDSPSKAPGGCLQYFTGTSGNIVSFNAGTAGALLDDLLYNVCIRREANMCSYTVREARSGASATPDAFQVGADSTTAGRIGAANCATAMLIIPNSAIQAPEYCGAFLVNTDSNTVASPVTGNGAQFQITVLTLAGNAGAAGTGFDLVYAQLGTGC